jgi:hypothetical protein
MPTSGLRVLVTETDLPILDREQTAIGQRDPVDIPAQVLQDLLWALHGRFAVDHPPLGPDRLGQSQIGSFLTHQSEKQSAKELREGMDRHEVSLAGRSPLGPISGEPAGRHQTVDVQMIDKRPRPGVQDIQDPDQAAHIMRVRGQLDKRLRRGAPQDVVQVFLVSADQLPQLLGQGQDDMEVGDPQQLLAPLLQPRLGVLVVACGATAVAAGVVDVVCLTAPLARPQLPAQGLRAAVDDIIHGAAMAGQEVRAEPLPIVRAIAPQDVRHLRHTRAPARLEISHQGVDSGMHDVEGFR